MLENAGNFTLESYVINQQLERKGLCLEQVHQIATSLMQAVKDMHLQNICHRDLKPDNIMITIE